MPFPRSITENYPLIAAGAAWLAAQVLKFIIDIIRTGKFNKERLVGAGGMPSAHSATVCALVIAVSRVEGLSSAVFAVVVIMAFVVMYDAMGVRRAAGEQAKRINMILARMEENPEAFSDEVKEELEDPERVREKVRELKEYLGHTPLEVLGGMLLGIIVAMLIRL